MVQALLYLPDGGSAVLASAAVAGRSLTVRALVAALRAGATAIGVPRMLRNAGVERALRRMPALAAAVKWLDAGSPARGGEGPWLLVPASALVDRRALAAVLDAEPGQAGVVLKASAGGGAPVLLAPAGLVARLWERLARGEPVGADLARHVAEAAPEPRESAGIFLEVRERADLDRADAVLWSGAGSDTDTGVDQFLHRRCSRHITRALLLTPATPNQVSLASLTVGLAAIWCFWRATPWSAALGVALYAVASILDHSDGELARLTFQESRLGAHLDWFIDTIIHAGLVLGMAVTAGGPLMLLVGLAGAVGVTLSALFSRSLPHEIEIGPTVGGALKHMGNRDLFYLLLLSFVLLRWLWPPLLVPLALVVATGSQAYWIGCVARIRARGRARAAA